MATTASTTGINTGGINKIKASLEDYRNAVIKKCNIETTSKQLQSAIKGTNSEATLKAMAAAIDTKMKGYISQLNQYDNLLDKMQNAYSTNDANNKSFSDYSKTLESE